MIVDQEEHDNTLAHYGILRRSGRYPWGSGANSVSRSRTMYDMIEDMKSKGLSDTEIARGFGMTTTEYRQAKSIARNQITLDDQRMAQRLKDKGLSNVAIGERMGRNESSVRALLAPGQADKAQVLNATSNVLKDAIDDKGYIDVGAGVENHMGVSRNKLNASVAALQDEGYKVHYVKVPQQGVSGNFTTQKVLSKPDVSYSEVYANRDKIQMPVQRSDDHGRTFTGDEGFQPPISVNPKRVQIKYGPDGGAQADGVIYVRPGVKDVAIGNKNYAQVRIKVGEGHYLKGMAVYKDNLPDGVDLQFNTNKKSTGNKLDAMKPIRDDPDDPFGTIVRQYRDPKTRKVNSAMNVVNEEGDWDRWSRTLSSQMLSKQSPDLAQQQLGLTFERKRNELDEVLALTNPTVKRRLLKSFSDDADASAVHLKAAALPGQSSKVILPIRSIKPGEVYAPTLPNGTRVALVRHPHGGIFEIPDLVVNNRNQEARKILGAASLDAVGIHHTAASKLSGADFDGDTVLLIPNNSGKVKSRPALEGLKGFDPQTYKIPDSDTRTKRMGKKYLQQQMGDISNLITDMTIGGASTSELARAVRHSMVVIDSEKHGLDYRASAKDNGIAALKKTYQGRADAGASTLVSRASSKDRQVLDRRERRASEGGAIDRSTGKRVYVETGAGYTKDGVFVPKRTSVERMALTDDAYSLVSSNNTRIERVYADHANKMKALGNSARKSMVETPRLTRQRSAAKVYSKQVEELNKALEIALRNAPLERQAQVLANAIVTQKLQANPSMEPSDLKKVRAQALAESRIRTGAKKQRIVITPEQWVAIQAGAVSDSKLDRILTHADLDRVKELATPRSRTLMTSAKTQQAKLLLGRGYTLAEVAAQMGVSLTTLKTSVYK